MRQDTFRPLQVITPIVPAPTPHAINTNIPKLDNQLNEILAAYQANDWARLELLASGAHFDLERKTVRVILEMASDSQARPGGTPVIEKILLPDGRTTLIEHAPPMVIREDWARAIAATGATYETAFQTLIQVLAPFDSLPALAEIPDVRWIRLPYPTQP